MSTPTFRSLICSRGRPELFKTGQALSNYFREFSTTQSVADDAAPNRNNDGNNRGRGNARQRGRAAASAINTMVKNRGPSPNGRRPDGNVGAPVGAGDAPKVLDVRSLPRGLGRGRGGFRGRGGAGAGGRGGFQGRSGPAPDGTNRFAGGRGGSSNNNNRGGRGRGRGQGTGTAARGRGGREGGEQRERPKRRVEDPTAIWDEAELAFDSALRFGHPREYKPVLNVESILEHAPAVPTSAPGRRATVLEGLQSMGGGTIDSIGVPSGYMPDTVEGRVEKDGFAFFANAESRTLAEDHIQAKRQEKALQEAAGEDGAAPAEGEAAKVDTTPVFSTASEAVQKVLLESAIAGKHETPKFATDVHGIVRSQQLRAGGYSPGAMSMFQKKLQSLVGAPKPAAADKPAAKPAAKAAKPAKEAKKPKAAKA